MDMKNIYYNLIESKKSDGESLNILNPEKINAVKMY